MALQAIGLGANWVPPQCSPAGGVQPQAHPCPQLCWGVAPSPAAHFSLFSASKGCGGRGGRWGGQGVAPTWRADSEQSRIYYPETRAWSGVGGREGSILWARIPPWAEAGGTGFRLLFKCQQVAKSKLPFQKLQHGKHVGILLVAGKMVHFTYDS